MIGSAILVLLGVLALLFVLRATRGAAAVVTRPEDLPGYSVPVDVTAFLNLIDGEEQAFLARNLDHRRFRQLQRQRRRAARAYVRAAAQNAALLLRFAEAARSNPDSRLAESAAELATTALSVRLACLELMVKLSLPLPGGTLHARGLNLVSSYERASYKLDRVVRLQQPKIATRVCSAFIAYG
jgi:hypothetical protein